MRLLIDPADSGRFRTPIYINSDPETDVYFSVFSGDWGAAQKVAEILIVGGDESTPILTLNR